MSRRFVYDSCHILVYLDHPIGYGNGMSFQWEFGAYGNLRFQGFGRELILSAHSDRFLNYINRTARPLWSQEPLEKKYKISFTKVEKDDKVGK